MFVFSIIAQTLNPRVEDKWYISMEIFCRWGWVCI